MIRTVLIIRNVRLQLFQLQKIFSCLHWAPISQPLALYNGRAMDRCLICSGWWQFIHPWLFTPYFSAQDINGLVSRDPSTFLISWYYPAHLNTVRLNSVLLVFVWGRICAKTDCVWTQTYETQQFQQRIEGFLQNSHQIDSFRELWGEKKQYI